MNRRHHVIWMLVLLLAATLVVVTPQTTGSTSAGAVWLRVVQRGIAPKALLFANQIDSLAAGGLIVVDVWAGRRIVTVDQLGDEFLSTIRDGDLIAVYEDGTVTVLGHQDVAAKVP